MFQDAKWPTNYTTYLSLILDMICLAKNDYFVMEKPIRILIKKIEDFA